jgi:hypothetical protein
VRHAGTCEGSKEIRIDGFGKRTHVSLSVYQRGVKHYIIYYIYPFRLNRDAEFNPAAGRMSGGTLTRSANAVCQCCAKVRNGLRHPPGGGGAESPMAGGRTRVLGEIGDAFRRQ